MSVFGRLSGDAGRQLYLMGSLVRFDAPAAPKPTPKSSSILEARAGYKSRAWDRPAQGAYQCKDWVVTAGLPPPLLNFLPPPGGSRSQPGFKLWAVTSVVSS